MKFTSFISTICVLNSLQIHRTGYFLPWHRIFIQTFEDELRSKCGYTGVHPYWDWTKGNASGLDKLDIGPNPELDTEDFYHASIFSNSTVDGLGSWGDPANDFQITTGGFKDIKVAYPVPHNIRRNFTLQPFLGVINPRPSAVKPGLMVNTTFTKEVVDHAVSSFTEDFVSFQTYVESVSGPHSGVHFIVGGDMSGRCPFGLKPPNCIPGAKWAPSGERDSSGLFTCTQSCPPHRSNVLPSSCGAFYRQFHWEQG